jgi:hypothetical protein
VTWKEIVGTVNPVLVMLSALIGLVPGLGVASVGVLMVSQIAGEVSSVDTAENNAPVFEEKWET